MLKYMSFYRNRLETIAYSAKKINMTEKHMTNNLNFWDNFQTSTTFRWFSKDEFNTSKLCRDRLRILARRVDSMVLNVIIPAKQPVIFVFDFWIDILQLNPWATQITFIITISIRISRRRKVIVVPPWALVLDHPLEKST